MCKDVALYIQKDGILHTIGNPITGDVNLKALRPLYVSKIELRISKKFAASYKENPLNNAFCGVKTEKNLYNKTFVLYQNPLEFDEISSGHHIFPFQICLSGEDNGSVCTQMFFESSCYLVKNQYFLEAVVYARNLYKPHVISSRCEVYLVDRTYEDKKKLTTIDFSYCFCLLNTNGVLETLLDKKTYFSGDTAKLEVFVRDSMSRIRIKGVTAELYQCLEVEINGERMFDRKLVSKTKGYFDTDRCRFLADIRIPFTVPSNVTEKYLKIKNLLYILVFFDMSLPVRIQKSINIIKNHVEVVEEDALDVLEGTKQPIRLFKI